MSTIKFTYQSDIVLGFREIPKNNFSRQIYFIEQNQDNIQNMDTYFKTDLLEHYNNALFELGHFRKCLKDIDSLILDVIDYNFYRKEEDVFQKLLLRKSRALYNIGSFNEAEHVIKELLKINPNSESSIKIFQNIISKTFKSKTTGIRALCIMMLLFGIGLTCFDLLVVQNFFPEQAQSLLAIRNFMMLGSGTCIIGIEISAYLIAKTTSKQFQLEFKDKKSKNSQS